jgi:hypothetical protein
MHKVQVHRQGCRRGQGRQAVDLTTENQPAAVGLGNLFVHFTPLITLSAVATGTIYTYTPGFAGTIVAASFVTKTPVTTAAKAATLTWSIAATPTTGGAIAVTSAAATPAYKEIQGTQVTAANVFTAAQVLTLVASAVTTFVEGDGYVRTLIVKS